MTGPALDAIDKGILYHLQQDGRAKLTEIAEEVNVSENTVRNRMNSLEQQGVIKGYSVDLNYPEIRVVFICSAPITTREDVAAGTLDISGVVEARTLMTGRRNLAIEAVAKTEDDITRIARKLDSMDDIDIEEEFLIRSHIRCPFEGYALDAATDS